MLRCLICGFFATLDDAVCPTTSGCCICLRCFQREVAGVQPGLADYWRTELRQALEDTPPLVQPPVEYGGYDG